MVFSKLSQWELLTISLIWYFHVERHFCLP